MNINIEKVNLLKKILLYIKDRGIKSIFFEFTIYLPVFFLWLALVFFVLNNLGEYRMSIFITVINYVIYLSASIAFLFLIKFFIRKNKLISAFLGSLNFLIPQLLFSVIFSFLFFASLGGIKYSFFEILQTSLILLGAITFTAGTTFALYVRNKKMYEIVVSKENYQNDVLRKIQKSYDIYIMAFSFTFSLFLLYWIRGFLMVVAT